jgi:TRAP-type C4-dicarboxylate transport system permease small subunit
MGSIVSALISLLMVIAALVFFFMLIWGGIAYITSGGDKAQTEAARGRITAALIGLVIVFAAWAVITLVNALFGIDILSLNISSAVPAAGG